MRQRKKYDEKILQAKPYAVGQYVWVFQNVLPPKGTKKLLKKWKGTFMITEVQPARTVLPLDYWACSALRKLETSCPIPRRLVRTTKYGGFEYLLVEPACERKRAPERKMMATRT